jgi:hypothetical protein
MTMDPEERLAALESRVGTIDSYLRRTAERQAQAEAAALQARLAPTLSPDAALRRELGSTPDLGNTLMDRLRADASLSHAAGSGLSALTSGNILGDAVFDAIAAAGWPVTLTTSWADLSPYWEARYTLDSGAAPTTIEIVGRPGERSFYSSSDVYVNVAWAAKTDVGQVTVELRSKRAIGTPPPLGWPFIVAAARVYEDPDSEEQFGSATANVAIVDASTGADLARSEDADIAGLVEGFSPTTATPSLEAQPYVALDRPSVASQILLTATIGSDGTTDLPRSTEVHWAEPQLVWADEETPQSFQPNVGRWNPTTRLIGAYYSRDGTAQTTYDNIGASLNFPSAQTTKLYDTEDMHVAGVGIDDRFTSRIAGYYDIRVTGEWEANASASARSSSFTATTATCAMSASQPRQRRPPASRFPTGRTSSRVTTSPSGPSRPLAARSTSTRTLTSSS